MGEARWFRLDVTWHESKWLAALPWAERAVWPVILGHVKEMGTKGRCREPIVARLAAGLDIPVECVESCVSAAVADGALIVEGGEWIVANWETYQNPDDSKERVTRFRNNQKRGVTDVKRECNAVTPSRDMTGQDRTETGQDNPPNPPGCSVKASPLVAEVVGHFNLRAGRTLKPDAQAKFVSPRLKAGASVEDLKLVIDFKTCQWKGTDQEDFLRPETLFRAGHWDDYLERARKWDAMGRPAPKAKTNGKATAVDIRRELGDLMGCPVEEEVKAIGV